MRKKLIIIAGATAVGKTSMAMRIARHFNTEIISADSRQFFREMTIGTGKPKPEKLALVKQHMVSNLSICDDYDAGKFAEDARKLIASLFTTHYHVVVAGGSGMYIKALCDGFDDMPDVSEKLRLELTNSWQAEDKEALLDELKTHDPEYFQKVDHSNRQRVTRALEVIRIAGRPYTSYRQGMEKPIDKGYTIIKIGLERERQELYDRINRRMDRMIEEGLFEEAAGLYDYRHLNALQTVGYREIHNYMDGLYDKEEAVRLLKRNSRRYAKRQMTWFKRDEAFTWFAPAQKDKIIAHINQNG